MSSKVLALLFSLLSASSGAKILGIVPYPSYSHQVVFQPLWKELSLRGHQVTTLTTDPIRDPNLVNLTEIDLSSTYDIWRQCLNGVVQRNQQEFFAGFVEIISSSISFIDKQLENPQVRRLIHDKDLDFDLVIVEYLTPAMFAFATRFNCPHIGITSFDPPSFVYEFLGNPLHPAFHADSLRPFYEKDTTLGRIRSVLHFAASKLVNYFYFMPANEALVKKHFGNGYPSLWSITENASALLVNTNTVFNKVLPLSPNIVHIGGTVHWQYAAPLTKEMQEILDASEGFLYFSLGSNVRATDLPPKSLRAILQTFTDLPYVVLWKYDSDDGLHLPKNVVTSKWFPQQAVLRHPKIKLFITQGGRQSMDEAIAANVPMIGMPVLADQFYNVQKMADQGYGLWVDPNSLQSNEFKNAILEIIQNPKYRKTLRKLADLANDQPMTGLERAVWWTEYILRHQGATHLRSPFLGIPLYQFLLLDILFICLFVLVIVSYILFILAKIVIAAVRRFKAKLKNE